MARGNPIVEIDPESNVGESGPAVEPTEHGTGVPSSEDGATGSEFVSPDSAESSESASGTLNSGSGKRAKRRASSGSTNARKQTAAERKQRKEKDTKNLELLLFSTHLMLSKIVSVEELALDVEEAKQLAEALDRVNELYDFSALSPKAMAWINLLTVAGGIYGPRVLAVSLKPPKAKGSKKPAIVIDGDMFAPSASKQ